MSYLRPLLVVLYWFLISYCIYFFVYLVHLSTLVPLRKFIFLLFPLLHYWLRISWFCYLCNRLLCILYFCQLLYRIFAITHAKQLLSDFTISFIFSYNLFLPFILNKFFSFSSSELFLLLPQNLHSLFFHFYSIRLILHYFFSLFLYILSAFFLWLQFLNSFSLHLNPFLFKLFYLFLNFFFSILSYLGLNPLSFFWWRVTFWKHWFIISMSSWLHFLHQTLFLIGIFTILSSYSHYCFILHSWLYLDKVFWNTLGFP